MGDELRVSFPKQVALTMEAMKVLYRFLESLESNSETWSEQRREYEVSIKSCDCVSEAFSEVSDLTGALMHMIKTYGDDLVERSNVVINHDEEKEKAALLAQRAQELLKSAIQPALDREKSKDDPIIN